MSDNSKHAGFVLVLDILYVITMCLIIAFVIKSAFFPATKDPVNITCACSCEQPYYLMDDIDQYTDQDSNIPDNLCE